MIGGGTIGAKKTSWVTDGGMIRDPFARAYQVRDGKVRVPATVAEHGARLLLAACFLAWCVLALMHTSQFKESVGRWVIKLCPPLWI